MQLRCGNWKGNFCWKLMCNNMYCQWHMIQGRGNDGGRTIMGFIICTRRYIYIFFGGLDSPCGPRPPRRWHFEITLRHTTLGSTPLDEWSARRWDLCDGQEKDIHPPPPPPRGIRTYNSSRRAVEGPRLRTRGHWDRLAKWYYGRQAKEDGMRKACVTHKRGDKCIQNFNLRPWRKAAL